MGCTQSKIENEETVTRCKERKQFMKEAVSARNAFAAAHSAYAMALKNTGAALSDYAQGEVQNPSTSISAGPSVGPSALPQPPVDPFPPPPPPLPPIFPQSPLQRAATMPEMSFPKPDMKHPDAILEEENEDEIEGESNHGLKHRSSKSSGGGLGVGVGNRSGIPHREEDELPKPPSPPPRTPPLSNRQPPPPPPPETKGMPSWDYFFPSMENVPGPTLAEVDEGRMEREEFERKVLEETAKRSEIDSEGGGGDDGDGDGGSISGGGKEEVAELIEKQPEPPPQAPPTRVKRGKQVAPAEAKRRGGSLLQIFNDLDDCFLKASESAHEVSKMLEAARLHYHSNFADNRGNSVK